MTEHTVVIGVGNMERGDDAVGPVVVHHLRGPLPDGVSVVESGGDPAMLLEILREADRAIVVDAMEPGGHPGAVTRSEGTEALARAHPPSSHVIGPVEVMDLAEALGRLPAEVVVYGVEGADFSPGIHLTEAVAEGIDLAVGMIMEDLADA